MEFVACALGFALPAGLPARGVVGGPRTCCRLAGEGLRELGADQRDGLRRGLRTPDPRQHPGVRPAQGLDARAASDRLPDVAGDPIELPVLDRSLLWPLVCALPARQRAVIVLRYYEDLSEAQIADALGCAPGTVKSQASAAIGALKRALAASGVAEMEES